ncbi:MAG: hypothetical protein N3I86_09315 [Verrucomicrobiae bacterium]|nr:hypothetical protein [Verrucomicrobiae bacterium]
MKTNRIPGAALALALLSTFNPPLSTCHAQGTAFTYQGRLDSGGSPAAGIYDVRFAIYDAASGGNQWGPALTNSATAVSNGLFTVTLDFGAGVFTGTARWLEIAVRTNGGGAFTPLAPRQALTPTPYAVFAANASQLRTTNAPAAGQVLTYDGSALVWQNPAAAAGAWALSGNSAAATNFLGTLNNQPLELRVNNTRALRLEPNATSPNVIAGSGANAIGGTVVGATISGGGALSYLGAPATNRVTDDFGTVGGGANNQAGNAAGATTDAYFATVGGGAGNIASGVSSTIGGGAENLASQNDTTVAGGYQNGAVGLRSTVGGGHFNHAQSDYATVGGGQNNEASGGYSTVGGGQNNRAATLGATVGGGIGNVAAGQAATVPGGLGNSASGNGSFAAGQNAQALHNGSFVWADSQATPPPFPQGLPFASVANDEFAIRARGGVRLNTDTSIFFGNQTRQMLNLWGTVYGIGVQANVHYARSDGDFFWYRKGAHSNTYGDPGPGGSMLMKLTSQGLSVCALEVRGGCDLAEPFTMSEAHIPRGSVVVIDEDHPGQLKLSTHAYDTHVAGVVSGANGVKPGIALKQEGALDQGENVALSGRVYVHADAAYGAIRPGDLLTTSDTPGHAMKVSDPARAQGAVLGKAMTPLLEGQGTVLVLVTLQ